MPPEGSDLIFDHRHRFESWRGSHSELTSSALSPATTQEERESPRRRKRPQGPKSPQPPRSGGRTARRPGQLAPRRGADYSAFSFSTAGASGPTVGGELLALKGDPVY